MLQPQPIEREPIFVSLARGYLQAWRKREIAKAFAELIAASDRLKGYQSGGSDSLAVQRYHAEQDRQRRREELWLAIVILTGTLGFIGTHVLVAWLRGAL